MITERHFRRSRRLPINVGGMELVGLVAALAGCASRSPKKSPEQLELERKDRIAQQEKVRKGYRRVKPRESELRNQLCSCGSGRKFKKCCMSPAGCQPTYLHPQRIGKDLVTTVHGHEVLPALAEFKVRKDRAELPTEVAVIDQKTHKVVKALFLDEQGGLVKEVMMKEGTTEELMGILADHKVEKEKSKPC